MKISPSILAADFANLQRDVERAADGGAAYIHVDVMDGHFVSNLSVGVPVVASLSKVCRLPLDVHLMIENPSRFVDAFADAGASILTIHAEAPDVIPLSETLAAIRGAGMRVGLSIKPETSVYDVEKYISMLDLLLVMTVEPGYGNQRFLPGSLERIAQARLLIERSNPSCELEIDGGVNLSNLADCARAGANVFVMGSAVFGGDAKLSVERAAFALINS